MTATPSFCMLLMLSGVVTCSSLASVASTRNKNNSIRNAFQNDAGGIQRRIKKNPGDFLVEEQIGSSFPSEVPSDVPSLVPSDAPSLVPSSRPSTEDHGSFVFCSSGNNSAYTEQTFPITFRYKVWLEEGVELSMVLPQIEARLALGVVEPLCRENSYSDLNGRRLSSEALVGVSAFPPDSTIGPCNGFFGGECVEMLGSMTIATSQEAYHDDYCSVWSSMHYDPQLVNSMIGINGVEAWIMDDDEIGSFVCHKHIGVAGIETSGEEKESDSSVGTGALVVVGVAGLAGVSFMLVYLLIKPRGRNVQCLAQELTEVDDDATLKDLATIAKTASFLSSLDSPSQGGSFPPSPKDLAHFLGARARTPSNWSNNKPSDDSAASDDTVVLIEGAGAVDFTGISMPLGRKKKKTSKRKKSFDSYQSCAGSTPSMAPINEDETNDSVNDDYDAAGLTMSSISQSFDDLESGPGEF